MADKHPLQPGDEVSGASGGTDWRPDQLPPSAGLRPPFSTVHNVGDNGEGTDQEHEVNIRQYGDDYDPTAPMRVKNVPWNFDPDNDGDV